MIIEDGSKLNFQEELENLINRHNIENNSNTPDFILARYINDCLEAYSYALQQRDIFFGFNAFDKNVKKK